MKLKDMRIGIAVTGSFCTYEKAFEQIAYLTSEGAMIQTIFSDASQKINCRFGKGSDFLQKAADITGRQPMTTIEAAEIIGPTGCLDLLVILPCTGNTMAKIAAGITDTPVLMAVKAQLRNEKPIVISMATNDALGMNLKNIGILFNHKHVYFVPFGQDDPMKKPNSMTADTSLLVPTMELAMEGRQYQPVIVNRVCSVEK
jgi:dipicolinate synthase subunit B